MGVQTTQFATWVDGLEYEEDETFNFSDVVIPTDLLPIMDCPSRWNSTYFFLKRVLKLRHPLNENAKEHELRKYEMEVDEWEVLREIFLFLKDFALITSYIEGSNYPTSQCTTSC